MTYPIHAEAPFWAAQIGEAFKHPFRLNNFVRDRRLTVCSSIAAAAAWGKLSNLWTTCFYSFRPRVPSWIWIRWIQYATDRNNFTSPPKLAMSTTMQNSAPTPSYFTSGQHFLETFTLLPETTRTINSRWFQRFSPQTANMTFATLWRTYLPRTSNNALT